MDYWRTTAILLACALMAFLLAAAAPNPVAAQTHRAPQSKLVAVDNNVHLQCLDFGGNGRALVFLPGPGSTAYIYYDFGQRFTDKFHVYAVTPRGYGASDLTREGYDLATRVEDLHGFLQAQGISRAILTGHSVAGDEMTAFASKHPDQVLALIYLDAAYDRSDPRSPTTNDSLLAKIRATWVGSNDQPNASLEARRELSKRMSFGIWSEAQEKNMRETTVVNVDGTVSDRTPRWVDSAISEADKKEHLRLQDVRAPALLLFARQRLENRPIKMDPATRRELIQEEEKYEKFVDGYLEGVRRQRNLKVIVLQNTMPALFLEKPAEVAKLMRMFLAEHNLGR
jgi:pimeloyl-ACP methyl ester carboxylesterase